VSRRPDEPRHGARLDADALAGLGERFPTAARYEWMFWDMAYRRESLAAASGGEPTHPG